MGRSIWTELNELRDLTERIVAGEFPTRSPLGPGQIQSKNIRARAITAPLINVSNLEAVNTQTGNLTVDGTITVSTAGKIVSGTSTDDWATFTTSPGGGQGYFHSYDATYGALVAFGDFNNVSGQYVKWDGLALTIKGVIVASSGSIAGWTITTDAIENSGGDVGMASSGHSGYAFWAGDATPASAEFSVTSAGALVASSATITGAITASSGSITGTLTVGGSGGIHLDNTNAKIYSGMTALLTGSGFWLARTASSVVFALGDGTTEYVYWNGTSLQIQGELRATSGRFTGAVTLGTSGTGSLSSGQSAYDTGTGFWLERNSGTPRFSIGNSAGNKLTWNGSTLAITGTLTSTAGSIGGWDIDASGIRLGSGSTTRGMDTGSTAFYAGSATPGSAPFRVSTAGALVATSATLTGAITASSLSITGTASFSGGSMTLPGGGTITSSTLDINSGTMGGLTVDGTLTIGSGGKIAFGASAADYLDDSTLHFTVTSTQQGKIRMQKAATNRHSILYSYDDATNVYTTLGVTTSAPVSNYNTIAFKAMVDLSSAGVANLQAVNAAGSVVTSIYSDAVNDRVRLIATNIRLEGMPYFSQSDFGGPGAYYGRLPVTFNGVTKYIHIFDA
jgi:hypothetical protein